MDGEHLLGAVTHLPNPHGVTGGAGKDARHVKVRNGKERPEVAIHDAIAASVAHVSMP